MRNSRVISLRPGADVRVMEATLGDLRRLLDLLPADTEPAAILAHLRTHLPDYLAVLADSLELPDGLILERLTLSEAETVMAAWWELHQSFFTRALAALGLELSAEQKIPPATSPPWSPPSASVASPSPGAGAGSTPSACLS